MKIEEQFSYIRQKFLDALSKFVSLSAIYFTRLFCKRCSRCVMRDLAVRDCSAFPSLLKSGMIISSILRDTFRSGRITAIGREIRVRKENRTESPLLTSRRAITRDKGEPRLCQGPRVFLSRWRCVLSTQSYINGSTRSHNPRLTTLAGLAMEWQKPW